MSEAISPSSAERGRPLTIPHGVAVQARWFVPVLLWIAVSLLAWLRIPALARNTGWAEDTHRFITDELTLGSVATVFMPYAGYLHFVPRLIAIAVVHITSPLHWVQLDTIICCAIVGGVGAGAYVLSADLVRSTTARVLIALVPALTPLAPIEMLGNAANIHSYLLFLAPFVFLAGFRSWWRSAILGVIAFAIACTEIQSLLFLPFLATRIHRPKQWPIAAGALAGWIMQVTTTLTYPRPITGQKDTVFDLILGFLIGPFAGSATWHTARIGAIVAAHGWTILWVLFVVALAVVAWAFRYARLGSRLLIVAFAWGSFVSWAASAKANDTNGSYAFASMPAERIAGIIPERYFAASSMLILAMIAVAVGALIVRRDDDHGRLSVIRRIVGAVVGVLLVATFAVNFVVPTTLRSSGPSWAAQVERAIPTCRATPSGSATFVAAPGPFWVTPVPCPQVLRSAHAPSVGKTTERTSAIIIGARPAPFVSGKSA